MADKLTIANKFVQDNLHHKHLHTFSKHKLNINYSNLNVGEQKKFSEKIKR